MPPRGSCDCSTPLPIILGCFPHQPGRLQGHGGISSPQVYQAKQKLFQELSRAAHDRSRLAIRDRHATGPCCRQLTLLFKLF